MDAKRGSIVSAVSLTALTLAVFSASRNSGPESQVRGFIDAAFRLNGSHAADFLTQPFDPAPAQQLFEDMSQLEALHVTIRKTDFVGSQAVVLVSFSAPTGAQLQQIFVLKRTTKGWRIDPYDTVHFMDHQL